MMNLTFGEQVKIILSRKGMTIKELAELVEYHTGKPMSRQNMTQRLGRDNFQEKDMRLIAEILGCKFQLSIMEMDPDAKPVTKPKEMVAKEVVTEELSPLEREVTVGELLDMEADMGEDMPETVKAEEKTISSVAHQTMQPEPKKEESEERRMLRQGVRGYLKKSSSVSKNIQPAESVKKNEAFLGDINPYTGKEYKTNSVRMHPKRIGYVQVYDQEQHKWTDMTEWAFLGYQERKKLLLGKDYEPPIYLD